MEKIDLLKEYKKSVYVNIGACFVALLFILAGTQFLFFQYIDNINFNDVSLNIIISWAGGFICLLIGSIILFYSFIDDMFYFLKKHTEIKELILEEKIKEFIKKEKV